MSLNKGYLIRDTKDKKLIMQWISEVSERMVCVAWEWWCQKASAAELYPFH